MGLWKAFFVAAMSWSFCVGAEAQVHQGASAPVEWRGSNAADLRGANVGVGVVHDGYVYVMVEGELALVVPLEELDFQLVHGKVMSVFVTADNVAWIIIHDKPLS